MIGRVGADDFGARLLKNLVDAEVDSRAVVVDETVGSGMSAAIVRDDGDYGAVIVSGANLRLEPQAVAGQWKAVGGASQAAFVIVESEDDGAEVFPRATRIGVTANYALLPLDDLDL